MIAQYFVPHNIIESNATITMSGRDNYLSRGTPSDNIEIQLRIGDWTLRKGRSAN